MAEEIKRSCADCASVGCNKEGAGYPDFCLTTGMDNEVYDKAMSEYSGENRKIMMTAAEVELEGYLKWPRVQETAEFAKRMGYKKLGIATCAGLLKETRMLARILRGYGFEVYGIGCKVGATEKKAVGIEEKHARIGKNMCNPILQAKLLEAEGTELNIVMGLCVGHDSLFYKYSHTVTTTLVTKDRVTGNNPAAALYTAESYYKRLLQ